MFLIQILSSTDKLPWLYCDNEWNTESCRPYPFLASNDSTATTTSGAISAEDWIYQLERDRLTSPAAEYFHKTQPSVLSTLVLWVLILLSLVQGTKSLLKSFFVGFPLLHFLNALLFFRAISLPGTGIGYQILYEPNFSGYTQGGGWIWAEILEMSLGGWFLTEYGCLFVVGKYIKESIFPIPHVLIAAVVCFVLNILNSLKSAAFLSNYCHLLGLKEWNGWMYQYFSAPVALSQQPGSIFWLILHFIFDLGISIPAFSFVVETVAISLAEFLPGLLAHRTKLPQNMILTAALGIIGFGLSVVYHYLDPENREYYPMLGNLDHVYFLVTFLIIAVLVPMSLSKVMNAGRETLLDFVGRQGKESWSAARQRITLMMVIIGGVHALFVSSWYWPIKGIMSIMYSTCARVTLGVVSLIVVVAAVVQIVLFCCQQSRYPCCFSVGKQTDPEADLEETIEFPSKPCTIKCKGECQCFGCVCACK